MKSILAVIVLSVAAVSAFTPGPSFVSHERSTQSQNNRHAVFLFPFNRKEKGEESREKDAATAIREKNAAELTGVEGEYEAEKETELSEVQKLLQQVKDAGVAGVISYAGWELAFWTVSVPVCVFGYREVTGHWPDFANLEDQERLAAEAFAFVNFARFAVPLRIGLALGTTPWIQENVVDRFMKKEEEIVSEPSNE
jgi:hypothetical protein